MNRMWGWRRPAAAAVIAAAGLLATSIFAGATTASAAPTVPAGLSITITDGVRQVHSDSDVTYTVKLTNAYSTKVATMSPAD